MKQNTGWQLQAKCYDALEAMAFLKKHTVDFVFLDINMPRLSGMELATLLPDTRIVFTTAYTEYAADSYNFKTIDYLLKPITLKRFLAAQQKIEAYFSAPVTSAEAGITAAQDGYFFVKSGKVLRRMLLDDILYFEGEKEYVRLVTAGEQILMNRRLKEVEEQLAIPFVRVHNSYIVNIKQLNRIQDNHIFIGSKQIPISEKYRDQFMAVIQEKLF
ncbi:DNA-binding response regulator [Deminuibacter soli]|uniref:DNA-binding response regulator n=1 Tax=Deminuibacter soli TaxID=2291815 RepID=A0A3E1NJJ7_9BACT|nr:DNA-binding response regulator [Deminuibacter soli]